MAKFDENKKASMDDMENVAGGNREQSKDDIVELWKRGFFSNDSYSSDKVAAAQNILHRLGYTGCKLNDQGRRRAKHGGLNDYADKNGKTLTRKEFWDQFEEEFI